MLWCCDLQLGLLWPCLLIDSRVCTPAIRSGVGSLRRPNFPQCSSACNRHSQSLLRSDPHRFFVVVSVPSSWARILLLHWINPHGADRFFFVVTGSEPIPSSSPSACGRSLLRVDLFQVKSASSFKGSSSSVQSSMLSRVLLLVFFHRCSNPSCQIGRTLRSFSSDFIGLKPIHSQALRHAAKASFFVVFFSSRRAESSGLCLLRLAKDPNGWISSLPNSSQIGCRKSAGDSCI